MHVFINTASICTIFNNMHIDKHNFYYRLNESFDSTNNKQPISFSGQFKRVFLYNPEHPHSRPLHVHTKIAASRLLKSGM